MNCAVGCLLLGLLNGLMVILLWTRTVQVQEISQKSTRPKWPRVYRLDNRSYSTIQPTTFTTYTMKIAVGGLLFGLLDFSTRQGVGTTNQYFRPTCTKVKRPPCDPL